MKEIIIINGLPGSGKGTQAEIIAHDRGLTHISSGQLVRQAINEVENSDFYRQIRKRYDQGTPQPDEVVNQLIEQKLKTIPENQGVIFDSYPFNITQARFLKSISGKYALADPVYIFLDINPAEIIIRLSKRKVCADCGLPISDEENKSCHKCGGKAVRRSDDNPLVVKTRIENYLPTLMSLEDFYQKSGKLYKINGLGTIEAIAVRIKAKLND